MACIVSSALAHLTMHLKFDTSEQQHDCMRYCWLRLTYARHQDLSLTLLQDIHELPHLLALQSSSNGQHAISVSADGLRELTRKSFLVKLNARRRSCCGDDGFCCWYAGANGCQVSKIVLDSGTMEGSIKPMDASQATILTHRDVSTGTPPTL